MLRAPSIGRAIDHVALLVPDLDKARDAIEALGFSAGSRGVHATFQTSNHLVMFDREYLELLGVDSPSDLNNRHQAEIALGGGLCALALPTADINADTQRAREAGIGVEPVTEFARPVGSREARFRVAFLAGGAYPSMTFLCQHLTPALVWMGQHEHRNGATAIRAIRFGVAEPQQATQAICTVLGSAPSADLQHLAIGGQQLIFSATQEPRLEIEVDHVPSLDALSRAGFVAWGHGGGVSVTHGALGRVVISLILRNGAPTPTVAA